jgi:hypothetical protein
MRAWSGERRRGKSEPGVEVGPRGGNNVRIAERAGSVSDGFLFHPPSLTLPARGQPSPDIHLPYAVVSRCRARFHPLQEAIMNQRTTSGALCGAVAVVLLGGSLVAGDAKTVKLTDTLKITIPQPARLQFPNGRVWDGTLVKITDTEIVFQLRAGGERKVKIEEIKAIGAITDDDVFFFDSNKKGWDSVRTRLKAEEEARGKTPFDKNPKIPATGDRICMVAEGTGTTEAKAVAEAEADAASRAVYSVLDGVTAVQKQKDIEEKVLPSCASLARGRSRVLPGQRKTEENRVTVRIGVVFDRKEIVERLAKAGITVSTKPRGVAAAMAPREEVRRKPEEFLRAALADCARTVTVDALQGEVEDSSLKVHLKVTIDQVAYDIAAANLVAVLEALKRPENGRESLQVNLTKVPGGVPRYRSEEWSGKLGRLSFQDAAEWDVWVMTQRKDDWSRENWERYIIEKANVERSLAGLLGRLGVEVYLMGVDGSVLAYSVVSCETGAAKAETWKWALVHQKNPADNRNHLLVSPSAILLNALVNQRLLDVKVHDVFSPVLNIPPLLPGQRVGGVQARLVLME